MNREALCAAKAEVDRLSKALQLESPAYIVIEKSEAEIILAGNRTGLVRLALILLRIADEDKEWSHQTIDNASEAEHADVPLTICARRAPWDEKNPKTVLISPEAQLAVAGSATAKAEDGTT